MLGRFKAAGLVWPTAFTLAALAMLLGLGTWQLQRKAWKDALIAAIGERTKAAPLPLSRAFRSPDARGRGLEYLRVRLAGTFRHGQERHLYMPGKQGPGWHIITPLVTADGIVLVNRGWVPDSLKDPDKRRRGQLEGHHALVGLVRMPERPGWFTPANDAARNMWFWRDIDGMLACRNAAPDSVDCRLLEGVQSPPAPQRADRFPFFVDAEAEPASPGGWPKGGTTNFDIPNRHLEYAFTWYGLALTLIGVYIAFARGRLKALRA